MQRTRLHTLTDWNGGINNSTAINTLLYSYPNNFAALIPIAPPAVTTTYTGVQLFGGAAGATLNGGNSWVSLPSAGGPASPQVGAMVTTHGGDTLTIPVPAGINSVLIVLAGVMPGNLYKSGDPVAQSGAIRNGAKVSITVDGALYSTVDTNNVVTSPGLLVFSGVGTHTIVITHTGTQDVGVATPSMLAVVEVQMAQGGVVAGGVYTSPVIDSGDPRTQWFITAWRETPIPQGFVASASIVSSVEVMASNAIVNQNTQPYKGNLLDATASGGVAGGTVYPGSTPRAVNLKTAQVNPRLGCAGLPDQAIGRYAQFIITFGLTALTNPYLIDFDVYSWVPEYGQDDFLANLFLPPNDRIGPNMLAYLGCLAKLVTDKYNDALDLNNSYAISTAASQYLPIIGADRGLTIYSGEDPDTYRARILAASQSYANGGSAPNICQIVSILVNNKTITPVVTVAAGGYTVATSGGVVVQGGANLTYTVTIPPAPYPGLSSVSLALARTIISDLVARLNPIGFVPTVVFS